MNVTARTLLIVSVSLSLAIVILGLRISDVEDVAKANRVVIEKQTEVLEGHQKIMQLQGKHIDDLIEVQKNVIDAIKRLGGSPRIKSDTHG